VIYGVPGDAAGGVAGWPASLVFGAPSMHAGPQRVGDGDARGGDG